MRYLTILILLVPFSMIAQDQIFHTNGSKTTGKVELVSIQDITVMVDDQEVVIPTDEIVMILYANGTHEMFNVVASDDQAWGADKQTEHIRMMNNNLSFDYLGLVAGRVNISYERFLGDRMGLRMTLSGAFANWADYDYDAGIGLDLLVYPFGERRVTYYVGPSTRYYLYDLGPEEFGRSTDHQLGLYMINGLRVHPTPKFNIGLDAGFGAIVDKRYTDPHGIASAYISYKFN